MPSITSKVNRPIMDLGDVPDSILNRLQSESFRVAVNQSDDEIELLVMGFVGDEWESLDAKSVAVVLGQNPGKPVRVRINSPGGLLYDGLTIHNALVKHDGPVTTEIEGMAASAAAIIAVAGDTVRMAGNGELFVHRAMGLAIGNRSVMEDMAEWLAKGDTAIAKTFAAKTGKTPEAVMKLLEGKVDGTVFNADEALSLGFVDEIMPIRREKGGDSKNAQGDGEPMDVVDAVPPDPVNGRGEGQPGRWRKPALSDFTDESWENLPDADRKAIAKHFGWYGTLDTFGDLKLPHHFPTNHAQKGKASLNGVRAALARLNQTEGPSDAERERIEAHLRAHLPAEDRATALAAFRDDSFADEARDRQMRLEQGVLELAANSR